jgi:hypothetical protein
MDGQEIGQRRSTPVGQTGTLKVDEVGAVAEKEQAEVMADLRQARPLAQLEPVENESTDIGEQRAEHGGRTEFRPFRRHLVKNAEPQYGKPR